MEKKENCSNLAHGERFQRGRSLAIRNRRSCKFAIAGEEKETQYHCQKRFVEQGKRGKGASLTTARGNRQTLSAWCPPPCSSSDREAIAVAGGGGTLGFRFNQVKEGEDQSQSRPYAEEEERLVLRLPLVLRHVRWIPAATVRRLDLHLRRSN